MPAKRKVDPAQLQQDFENWKKTEESSRWSSLYDSRRDINLSTTSPDIIFDVSVFLMSLSQFASCLKVPKKSQTYEQTYLKTSFFPQVGIDPKISVDGKEYELHKQSVDMARYLREDFIKVLEALELYSQLDPENYIQNRKEMVKKLTSFEKNYMIFVKKGHDSLYTVQSTILNPLAQALEAYMNLYYLQYRDHEKRKWFRDPAPDFRMRACKEKFAETMKDLITLLNNQGPLKHNPNIMKSLSRLEIDTSTHDALKFFVSPVKKAWRNLRKVMKDTFKKGLVLYRHPIKDNAEVVTALNELLVVDNMAEELLGDSLKKDQLEFMYDVLNHISRSPFSERLRGDNKDQNSFIKSEMIPQLATFKALQQMYQVREDIAAREKELREVGLDLVTAKPEAAQIWSQDKEVRYDGIRRMWVWENYISEHHKPLWEEASYEVSKVNLMVQEDIADFIIARHIPNKPRPQEKEVRPPYVWNHYIMRNRYVHKEEPLYKEEEAPPEVKPAPKFRQHVRPEDYYLDGRVHKLIEKVEELSRGLKSHASALWELLVDSLIEAIKKEKPDSGAEDISFEEEAKEAEENKEVIES